MWPLTNRGTFLRWSELPRGRGVYLRGQTEAILCTSDFCPAILVRNAHPPSKGVEHLFGASFVASHS